MNAVRTIDVKGLGHAEREGQIFPGIEALKPEETLRIIVEFNPVPLVYMLKAQDKYAVTFEKEGPDEWILNVRRTSPGEADKKGQLKELISELGKGEVSDETKSKARTLLGSVDATTLGLLEQELIREGVSHDAIRSSLCDIHLEAMRDSLVAKRIEVQAPHPINTFMEEHKILVKDLKELSGLVDQLRNVDSYETFGAAAVARMKEISQHLVEAENHHKREEEVLFPRLEARDVVEPPEIMKLDHVEFRKRKQALYQLTHDLQGIAFPEYKAKAMELGQYLTKELDSHIFKEDNILYQIALQVLAPEEWEEVKRECDKIGYCCLAPEDNKKETRTKETAVKDLDLREIDIWDRHERIFKEWDGLEPGETLRIINDHNPKPLHYQFEAEYKGLYEWEYEQEGPKDWMVRIKKLPAQEGRQESGNPVRQEEVEKALMSIRPALQEDGGDVRLVSIEDGIVKVQLTGACGGCPMSQVTLSEGVERAIRQAVPGVKQVVAV